jgi:hypothetical protein
VREDLLEVFPDQAAQTKIKRFQRFRYMNFILVITNKNKKSGIDCLILLTDKKTNIRFTRDVSSWVDKFLLW